MKCLLIFANIIAAAALYFLGNFAVAAHRTHAYSVYQELKIQNVLNERPDYDIEKRLRTVAAGGMYSLWIAEIGSGICIVNAIALWIWFKKPNHDSKTISN